MADAPLARMTLDPIRVRRIACTVALVLGPMGCGDSDSGAPAGGATAGGAAPGNTGTGGVGDSGGGDLLPATGSGAGSSSSGCQKVDFLFVIDNSVSMEAEQATLIQSFPGFIESIQSTLSAKSDYHIMVTDTDDWGRCTESNCETGNMDADELCIQAADGYACETQPDECDQLIGAGVVHPMGKGASNEPCPMADDRRYLLGDDAGLTDTFACAAQVGLAGHPKERPMDSLVAAVSHDMNELYGCNAGFLRGDAILVVTFITDDPNYEDHGTPSDWYQAVKAAKGGNEKSVVMLGLTPNFPGCSGDGPTKGTHWSEFIALWGERGLEASVCGDDYTPFFDAAVAIIDPTCDNFEPPK